MLSKILSSLLIASLVLSGCSNSSDALPVYLEDQTEENNRELTPRSNDEVEEDLAESQANDLILFFLLSKAMCRTPQVLRRIKNFLASRGMLGQSMLRSVDSGSLVAVNVLETLAAGLPLPRRPQVIKLDSMCGNPMILTLEQADEILDEPPPVPMNCSEVLKENL